MTLNNNNSVLGKDSRKNPLKRDVIDKRWLDLIILSFTAPLIYFIVSLYFNTYFSKTAIVIGRYSIWIQSVVYIFIFTLLWLPAVRHGSFSAKSFLPSTFSKYPPFWLACIFSILAIYFLPPHVEAIISGKPIKPLPPTIIMLYAFGTVIAGALIAVVYSRLIQSYSSSCGEDKDTHNTRALQSSTEDPDALLQWIAEEKPISAIAQDRLNHNPFAERIVAVLRQPKITITVIGGYGAGKSSILNMIKRYLHADVANWRFRSKSATDSGANRPPVPEQIGRLFRSKSAACSDPNRPGIPDQTGHPYDG